jgi:hypothetical protein
MPSGAHQGFLSLLWNLMFIRSGEASIKSLAVNLMPHLSCLDPSMFQPLCEMLRTHMFEKKKGEIALYPGKRQVNNLDAALYYNNLPLMAFAAIYPKIPPGSLPLKSLLVQNLRNLTKKWFDDSQKTSDQKKGASAGRWDLLDDKGRCAITDIISCYFADVVARAKALESVSSDSDADSEEEEDDLQRVSIFLNFSFLFDPF